MPETGCPMGHTGLTIDHFVEFAFGFGYSLCRQHPNHGRNIVYDTIRMWHNIPQQQPRHSWIKRILAWHPAGHKRIGRPKYCWDTMLTNFCQWPSHILGHSTPAPHTRRPRPHVSNNSRSPRLLVHSPCPSGPLARAHPPDP